MSLPKRIINLLLRFFQRITSPLNSIHNLFQLIKSIDQREYSAKDPFDGVDLYSPTYSQLACMRKEILIRKKYYQGIKKIAEKNQGKVILDVGANIGYCSRAYSHYCKDLEIVAIEPSIKNLSFCARNLKDRINVTLYHCGLGENFGRFNLAVPTYASNREGENKFNTGLFSAIGNESQLGTRFFEFDSFCDFIKIDPDKIAWIKIDVEGFELNVLKGMKKLLRDTNAAIEIELNPEALNLSETEFKDWLLIFSEFHFTPMRNKEINTSKDFEKLIVLDLVFVKKDLIPECGEYLDLVEFSENEIKKWNEAFKSKFG